MITTATKSAAIPAVSDSIVDMFGGHKDIIEENYKLVEVENETLNNRVVRLTLKNSKHVTLLLDHPWLLNGNYSTPTSVYIFDSKGSSHQILSWIILKKLIQLMPIADLGSTLGYSVYSARFRRINNSDMMHLYLKDFTHKKGDILKFPPPQTPVDINHAVIKYSEIAPLSIPLAISINYNTPLESTVFTTVSNIKIGAFDYPYNGKISTVHSGDNELIEEYEVIITYCSKKFLIDSARTSEATKDGINYYKFKETIYQSYKSSYGLYNIINDISRPRIVEHRVAAIHRDSMKAIPDITVLKNLPILKMFSVYSYITLKGYARLYMFRKDKFGSPKGILTLMKGTDKLKITKVNIQDDIIYKLTSNIAGHVENYDRYLIGNKIYYSPDKDFRATVFKQQEIENEYINRSGIDKEYLKRVKGLYRYYDYGIYKAKRLKPLPQFAELNLPNYYKFPIFGNPVIYKAIKSSINISKVLYKDQVEWKPEVNSVDIEELNIPTVAEFKAVRGKYPSEDLEDVIIHVFRPANGKHNMIIYDGPKKFESFETTKSYDDTPSGLEWSTYDAAPYIIQQFLPPNSYPVNSAVFNIYPTTEENTIECLLKPSVLFTSAITYLKDVCSKLDFNAYTDTKNQTVSILELMRSKFEMERYIHGRSWSPLKFNIEDIFAHMKSNMNPANIDIGAVEDLHPDIYDVFIERIVRLHTTWIPTALKYSINYLYEEYQSRDSASPYELKLFKDFNLGPMGVVVNTNAIEILIDMLEFYALRSH